MSIIKNRPKHTNMIIKEEDPFYLAGRNGF
jgi:hypothetical protein